MNILQILPELNSGGVETGTIDLAKELVKQGHKAVVISNGGRLVDELKASGGIHYSLPVHKKSLLTLFESIDKIKDIIEKENIDVVHARSRAPAWPAFFAARLAKRPFITTCHGHYSMHFFSRVMGWGKFVIVSSNVVARHMINDFKVPHDRIKLIPRGVDLDKFTYKEPDARQSKKEFTIGMVGRITPIKGHIFLIRAVSKVARIIPNIKVVIIGDAPESKPKYRQELETLVRRLGLSRHVHFLGEQSDIPARLHEMDMLVMPSICEETFGRVIIEAQACGVPVIATKVGGIVDIIKDGKNGLLVPPRDWNALAEAIIRLVREKDLRVSLSKAGRQSVEKDFSLSHMYKKTINLYAEALKSVKILAIKWSALGDIILSLASLRAIKEKYPDSKLILLTSGAGRDFLSRYPYVNEFMIFHKKKRLAGIDEMLSISSDLRREDIDVIVDLQNNKKSRLISFLSFAPRRIGYKSRKFDLLMNETIPGAKDEIPPVAHQMRLLKFLGIDQAPQKAELMLSDEEKEFAENIFSEGWIGRSETVAGINAGASPRWQTKKLGAEKIARLCDMLAQKKIRVILTGLKEDIPEIRKIQRLCLSKPFSIAGRTDLMQLAAVIQRCRLFVTSDSAPLHLAELLEVPLVAFFGPTDPKRHIEPGGESRIIYKRLRCSPCYKSKCRTKKCMDKITVEEIAAAVKELLKGK